jgi:hypothetical protein
MHLMLFALALVSPPVTPIPQTPVEPRSPPVVAAEVERPPGRLAIHLGLRTRGPSPANAALTFSRLLGDLRDSISRSHTADSALAIEIRSLLPTAGGAEHGAKEYELTLSLKLGPDALPTFLQVLDHLASGTVTVSDLRLSADGDLSELADQMLHTVADSGGGGGSAGRTVGRLGRLALILLAIRREVRQ